MLTIVKGAVNFQCGNIFSQCGKLFFLQFADFSCRIKYNDPYLFYTQEPIGHGTARITGGCHKYGDLPVFISDKVGEATGHETGPHILECQRRTMEKFENIIMIMQTDQRDVKVQGIRYNVPQGIVRQIFFNKRAGNPESNFSPTEIG